MMDFSWITLNVRGLRNKDKRTRIFEWCKSKGSDISFLQETYSTLEVEEQWKKEWGGPMFFSHGSNHSKGVLILFSPHLDFKRGAVKIDEDGRYIIFKGEIQGAKFLLGNVYFPIRDKVQLQVDFLNKLNKSICEVFDKDYPVILGGDFNTLMDGGMDYEGPNIVHKSRFIDVLKEFLNKYDLEDIWRKRNLDARQFTFRQMSPLVQSRLDYWFISCSLEKLVKKCEILVSITPDHSGIRLQFQNLVDNFHFGKSYWKFNNSLCMDKHFVDGMNDKIQELKNEWLPRIVNKLVFWDFLKMKMREYAMKYSREKAKLRKVERETLEIEIKDLENQLVAGPSKLIIDRIKLKKDELNKLHDFSRQGIRVRSRAAWFEEGENNIQYFEQLMKVNKRKSVIRELYLESGEITRDKNEILKRIKIFYEQLYSLRNDRDQNDGLFFNNILKLSEQNRELCEGKMTKDECFKVLKEMKWNKSPGNDGFSVEFYYTFWPILGDLLVEVLNETYVRGELTVSQKQGTITLIEKEGKDAMHIKNYRPITLLNVDYKILSKVLATRMKKVLIEIIHYDQVGYIQDRNIGEAVRLIEDILFYSKNSMEQGKGFLIAVDFEKAFDSVSHQYLLKVLKLFGFGDSFCSWVKLLYNDISSCIMNGGYSTGYFQVERGVRQGDPLSPYLFLVAIELLAHEIRRDKIIKGIRFGEHEIRQVLYADDMTIFVKDIDSISRLQYIFEEFEKVSGLKVNKEKTHFMNMGDEAEKPDRPLFGEFVRVVKILGVNFSVDFRLKDDLNYKEILSKIKKLLGWWKQRDLTIMGKIHLLKTYALTKLNYVSSLLVVPLWVYIEVEKISFEFIWGGKDRIKRKIMYQNYNYGGVKMIDFELFVRTQRIMWVKRLLYGERNLGWKLFFYYSFSSVGGRLIFLCDYEMKMIKFKLKIPPYYLEMLKAWQEINNLRHFNGCMNPIIFNNRNICIKNKTVFDKELLERGIVMLNHIIDNGHVKPAAYFVNHGMTGENLLTIIDIFHAIPRDWKNELGLIQFCDVDLIDYDINLHILEKTFNFKDVLSRQIYDYFIRELQTSYDLQIRDGQNNYNFTAKELSECFFRPRITLMIGRQREFQFKLLHGAIYTKENLFRFGFVEDNLCSYCKQERETYSHIFLFCLNVKLIWQALIQRYELDELKDLNWRDIFVGLSGNSNRIKMCNTIIFMVKYILFVFRKDGILPTVDKIQKLLLDYKDQEKKIAVKMGKLGLHLQKWETVHNI